MKHGRVSEGVLCGWCDAHRRQADIALAALARIVMDGHHKECPAATAVPLIDSTPAQRKAQACRCAVAMAERALLEATGRTPAMPNPVMDGQESLLFTPVSPASATLKPPAWRCGKCGVKHPRWNNRKHAVCECGSVMVKAEVKA